jgi:predicted enzyme related to lactoylglutathione lyase
MESSKVSAVLFAKNLQRVATFYSMALGMKCASSDEYHSVLHCRGFELIVHQIPKHIADDIVVESLPKGRVGGAVRLDYPVQDIDESRRAARSLGGDIDDAPRRGRIETQISISGTTPRATNLASGSMQPDRRIVP